LTKDVIEDGDRLPRIAQENKPGPEANPIAHFTPYNSVKYSAEIANFASIKYY
jgi:hypothetical protein